MSRKIYCHICGAYCGEIRDATLKKGLKFDCCSPDRSSGSEWDGIFGDLLKGKRP